MPLRKQATCVLLALLLGQRAEAGKTLLGDKRTLEAILQPSRHPLEAPTVSHPPTAAPATWAPAVSLPTGRPFVIGDVAVQNLWVDPRRGWDVPSRGGSREAALRTLTAAWERIPTHEPLGSPAHPTGFHIHITPGRLTEDMSE